MIGPVESYQQIYVTACFRDFPDRASGMRHENECWRCRREIHGLDVEEMEDAKKEVSDE